MERNYLLVYKSKFNGEIHHRYFTTTEDMKDFIKTNLSSRKYWEILHKYEIKEV